MAWPWRDFDARCGRGELVTVLDATNCNATGITPASLRKAYHESIEGWRSGQERGHRWVASREGSEANPISSRKPVEGPTVQKKASMAADGIVGLGVNTDSSWIWQQFPQPSSVPSTALR